MKPTRVLRTGLLLGPLLAAAGCAPVHFRPVPGGTIDSPGVVISAEDDSFKLTSGERFEPPFHTQDCVVSATVENFRIAKRMGARPVRVQVPGRTEPLYGLLALCQVHPDATGPATRQYLISVPESYVNATSGGRVSVVFEETNKGKQYSDGFQHFDAWQLWLSEIPFI